MVASFSLFLLSLSASSYHCRHRSTDDGRRHATPLFGVKSSSSSRSSGLRREEEKKSLLSAHSARIEGQKIDGGGNILTSDIHELHWKEKHLLLKRFQEREGHCNVPQSHKEDGATLGVWISTQRQLKKKGKLDPERQKILEEIGFEWGVTSATWEESFALLKQFMKREGHCTVIISQGGRSHPWCVGKHPTTIQEKGKTRSRAAKDSRGNWLPMGGDFSNLGGNSFLISTVQEA